MTWLSKFVITFLIVIACQALGLVTWLVHFTPIFNGWFLLLLYPVLLFICIARIVSFYRADKTTARFFTSVLIFTGLFAWLVMGLSITVIFINGFYTNYYGKYYAPQSGQYFYFYQNGALSNETQIRTKDGKWPIVKYIPAMDHIPCAASKILVLQDSLNAVSFVACDSIYTYRSDNYVVTRQMNDSIIRNNIEVGHIEVTPFPVSLRSVW